jgi:CRISPR-associated exonuclease Cas4
VELIPVTDYHRVMPAVGKPTFKMKEAVAAQDLVESLEMRRGLEAYGLDGAQRRFNVWLSDEALGLSGKADLLLEAPGRVAVVDFKLTSGELGDNHRAQLAGYSMLAEAVLGVRAERAFVYRIPDNRIFAVEITAELRGEVLAAVDAIRKMCEVQWWPPPTPVRGRCVECEFANYCADVW